MEWLNPFSYFYSFSSSLLSWWNTVNQPQTVSNKPKEEVPPTITIHGKWPPPISWNYPKEKPPVVKEKITEPPPFHLSEQTQKNLQHFLPLEEPLLFLSCLETSFPGFCLHEELGEGLTSQVWRATYQNKTVAFRLSKVDVISRKNSKAIENYFQITKNHFGGEWAAFIPDDPYILKTDIAICWDGEKYKVLKRDEICAIYQNRELLKGKTLTLFATLSPFHVGCKTLEQLIEKKKGSFPLAEIQKIAFQILLGHSQFPKGMIHRDIKPANLLLTKEGVVKYIDFGFSKLGESEESLTNSFVGTPLYMAPEIFEGKEYSVKVDSYAIFGILFQMATGELYFPSTSKEFYPRMTAIIQKQLNPVEDSRLRSEERR
ncbi:MAG: serine/threonine-protein kinase, partial [Chlamydiia bacterium]|nr:serine/threonine-protein kinase [Chlamydiia bacterium]